MPDFPILDFKISGAFVAVSRMPRGFTLVALEFEVAQDKELVFERERGERFTCSSLSHDGPLVYQTAQKRQRSGQSNQHAA